jgi:hypothetical protein
VRNGQTGGTTTDNDKVILLPELCDLPRSQGASAARKSLDDTKDESADRKNVDETHGHKSTRKRGR